MIKLISGGGSSYADAVKNMSNKIDAVVCKEKCKFILSNVHSFNCKEMFKLAQEIREFLKQESVLVHDAKTKQVYFVTEK